MLKLLESIPVLGPFVVHPLLTAESFTVDAVLTGVNYVRLFLGL
jgi:hypothetical protein